MNMINFQQKLLITEIHQTFANKSAISLKFSKIQKFKITQLGGFIGNILGPILEMG